MIKLKIFFSIFIFSLLLLGTSFIKNETREIEKKIYKIRKEISLKKRDLNESQLDYYYLTSPSMIEEKIEHLDNKEYVIMDYSKIFLSMSDYLKIQNKVVIKGTNNEKKIQKK